MNKILIYNSGGGLGDSIQLIPLILSLKNIFNSSKFYYLGAHENHFENKLKEFNINISSLDLNLKYFGFRWWHLLFVKKRFNKIKQFKFDLIIDLQSKVRNTLILKSIPHINFYSTTLNNFFSTKKNIFYSKNHLDNLSLFLNMDIPVINFNIKQLPINILEEAEKLLPLNNYIGLSVTQGNAYRKKRWSIDKFISVGKEIVAMNNVPVFFIEKNQTEIINLVKEKIPKALFPEHQSNFSGPALVTALSTRLNKAITIDNGVMHMMSLSRIPLIILFGPTNPSKFAPSYKGIKVLDSKSLYNSYDIDKIKVEDVFRYLK